MIGTWMALQGGWWVVGPVLVALVGMYVGLGEILGRFGVRR